MARLLVFVRHLEDTFPIEVPGNGSVSDLRRAAQEAAGVRGRLLLGGRPLDDGELLADSGLSSQCVVTLDSADAVHVVWFNYDEPQRSVRDQVRRLHRLYCEASPACVPPSESEAGAKLLKDYADIWSRRTGLSAVGPLDKDITLTELLRDCVYSEGTKERAAMMQQLTEASKGPESDDEPCDTVVPHNHFFVASNQPCRVYSPVVCGAKITRGVHMYELTLKRAQARAFRFGWQSEASPAESVGDQCRPRGGWALCTLGGLRAADRTQTQCFRELVVLGSEPVPADTGDGQCTWGAGDTVATAIDCDRGQILFALPGKGWFVGFAGVSLSAPVMPAFAAVECLVDLNLGERPFKHPPPRGAAPVLRSANSTRIRVVTDSPRHENVTVRAGSTMPSRGLMTDAEYEEWRRLRRERRQAAWSPPPHPFADGWLARSSWRARSDMQWGVLMDVSHSYRDDRAPALDALLAASTSEHRPHGSDVLRYVRTLSRVVAAEVGTPEACSENAWYWRWRVAGKPPLLPLAAYSVRVPHRGGKRAAMRRSMSGMPSLRTCVPLWDQGVRPGDLLLVETKQEIQRLAVLGEPPAAALT